MTGCSGRAFHIFSIPCGQRVFPVCAGYLFFEATGWFENLSKSRVGTEEEKFFCFRIDFLCYPYYICKEKNFGTGRMSLP